MSGLDEQIVVFPKCKCGASLDSYIDLYCGDYCIGAIFSNAWIMREGNVGKKLCLEESILSLYKEGRNITSFITRVNVQKCTCGENDENLLKAVHRYLIINRTLDVDKDDDIRSANMTLFKRMLEEYK